MFTRPRLQSSRPFAVVGFVMTILKNKNLSNKLQFLSGSLLPFSADDMCLHNDHLEQVSKPPARRMRSAKRQSGRKMQAKHKKSSGRQHISVSLFFTFLSLHSKVPHTDGFVTLMMIKTVFQIRLSVCFLCVLIFFRYLAFVFTSINARFPLHYWPFQVRESEK